MSFRNQALAASAVLFIALCSVSSLAKAADTEPVVRDTCARETYSVRLSGHPGKSILLPVRKTVDGAECSTTKRRVLVLASFTDSAGGQALVRGQTERAMDQIRSQKASLSPNVLTNLCVAHTVLHQWTEARAACDAAVKDTLSQRAKAFDRRGLSNPADREVSVAYSNRAVLNWLTSDEAAAHQDLAKARRYSPGASYVARNWEATDRRPSLADNRTPTR